MDKTNEELRELVAMQTRTIEEMNSRMRVEAQPVAYADPKAFENFQRHRAGEMPGAAGHEWMWARPDAGLVPIYIATPPQPDSGRDAALPNIPTWEEETLCVSSDTAAETINKAKNTELYELRKALGIRRPQECVCGACGALWQFWPKEQSGFGQDTLSLKSKKSCDFCERAGFDQLDWLRRMPDSNITAIAAQQGEKPAGAA